jgi:hypothetical protein
MVRGFEPTTYCEPEYRLSKFVGQPRSDWMTRLIQSPVSNLCAIIEEILVSKLDMVGSGGIIGPVCEVPD